MWNNLDATRNKGSHILQTYICCLQNYNTLAHKTKSKALYLQWNNYLFLTLSSFNYGKCMNVESNIQSFSVFNIPSPTNPLKKALYTRHRPTLWQVAHFIFNFILIGLISDYCLALSVKKFANQVEAYTKFVKLLHGFCFSFTLAQNNIEAWEP